MRSRGVLVIGCSDTSANTGLEADERAVAALEVPIATVSTGSATRNGEGLIEVVEASPTVFRIQIDDTIHRIDYNVVKIGALFSEESIKTVSGILQQGRDLISVIDVEPFFKTGPTPKPEVVAALRKDILPFMTILSGTVPEVKQLLDEAGIPVDYPKSVQDVLSMAKTLRSLGPKYVIIKREIFDEEDKTTTLHFVLCGDAEPLTVTSRSENPKGVFGASYSIPPATAAYLAQGYSVPEAVSAGFKFIEEMLKGGRYFH